jgi:hypothetical protein
MAGTKKLDVHVEMGERRDALLFAAGANSKHGLKRTNADKRRAVLMLLTDEKWSQWSDSEIARRCAVNHHLVAEIRSETEAATRSSPSRRTRLRKTRNGRLINTSNIGGSSRSRENGRFETPCRPHAPDRREMVPVERQRDRQAVRSQSQSRP